MRIEKITYENYFGETKEATCYFHMTTPVFNDFINKWYPTISKAGELYNDAEVADAVDTKNPEVLINTAEKLGVKDEVMQNAKMMSDFVEDLVRKSYGVISDDGVTFSQSEELSDKFVHSAIYEALFNNMLDGTISFDDFIGGVMPKKVRGTIKTLTKNTNGNA